MTLDEARITIKPIRGGQALIFTTKGERIVAANVWLDEEHQDVIHDIISTNRPKRYERMGVAFKGSGWATPLEFITRVEVVKASGE